MTAHFAARTASDSLSVLRTRTSEKWGLYPSDVLPMFVAEMDFPLAPAIREALHAALNRGDTGYINPHDTGVLDAFSEFARDSWDWSPEPERMGITTDVSVVVVESLRRMIAPGDGVIITPPVYPPFYDLVPEAGGTVVEVPLTDDSDGFALDLEGIDRALAAGARAVLLCNPHNPLGLVHSREQLTALSHIVERHGAFVVSDEIHAPLTHTGHTFTPYLTVSDAARTHGIAAVSGSKAFNLAGLKCAMFVTASDPMTTLIRSLPDEVTFRTGLFGVIATREGFRNSRDWLAGTIAAIESNVDLLSAQLLERLPQVRLRRPSASYLAWMDMSDTGWGHDPAALILDRTKLALSSGSGYGPQGSGHARMNLACSAELVLEAVDRIARL
ncbi:MAG: hypothetical protein RL431_479 [Actinomycetota bacterium]|jgi:cystathionine beta-lyase